MSFLAFDFMQRALAAGVLVGVAAPAIGVYVVQRRLSLMGDGIGHVAFTGIAAGLVAGASPILFGIAFAVAGAVIIELLRERGRTAGDVALALIFYGGIAGAVLFLSLGNVSNVNLNAYLFGSIVTVSGDDLKLVALVATGVVSITFLFRKQLFAVAYDEEVARVSGLRVRALNLLIAVAAAISVAIAARVVGVLLVSAMLVLPVAAVQQVTRSFRGTLLGAIAVGVATVVVGLTTAYYADVAPAASIVLTAIGAFVVGAFARRPLGRN